MNSRESIAADAASVDRREVEPCESAGGRGAIVPVLNSMAHRVGPRYAPRIASSALRSSSNSRKAKPVFIAAKGGSRDAQISLSSLGAH